MRKYEVVFVYRPDLDEEKSAALIENSKTLLKTTAGKSSRLTSGSKRRLAYEVKDLREGVYIIAHINAKPEVAAELDRVFKITDDVLRHIIVREDV